MSNEQLLAQMAAAGVPPGMVELALRNPALLAEVQNRVANLSLESKLEPQTSEQFNDAWKQEIEQVKERHEQEKRTPPYKIPAPPRDALVESQRRERAELDAKLGRGRFMMARSYCGIPKSFSSAPDDLTGLTRVFLMDMEVLKTHKGQYLVCRIISLAILKLGITFIVEDQLGRAELLSIYNHPFGDVSTQKELDVLLPVGTVLIVKEPTYKRSALASNCLIRVDSPTDVLFPHSSDPLAQDLKWKVPPARQTASDRDFKAEGNSYFAKQQYRYRSAYRDALQVLARLEVDESLGTSSVKEKALLRRARAEEGMRLNSEALSSYEATLQHSSSNKEAQDGKDRVQRKLKESATGEYDWLAMYEKALQPEQYPEQDVGDYVGPIAIKKASNRGGGRGFFATRNIKAGEILLVEKAFVAKWPSPRSLVFCLNLLSGAGGAGCQVAAMSSIVAKLMDDGSLACKVNSLYGGPTILSPEEVPQRFEADLKDDVSVSIDTARIEAIFTYNTFGNHGPRQASLGLGASVAETSSSDSSGNSPSFLFLQSSFFNHSCASNALWETYSDIMIVRARAPIREGEEVFIPYAGAGAAEADNDKVTDILEKHFPTPPGCCCDLCTASRRDGADQVARRKQLMATEHEDLKRLLHSFNPSSSTRLSHSTMRRIKKLVTDIEATYAADRGSPIRIQLGLAHHLFGEALHINGDYATAIKHTYLAYEAQGGRISPSPLLSSSSSSEKPTVVAAPLAQADMAVIHLLVNAFRSLKLEKPNQARKWMRLAIETEQILSGGGKEKFDRRFEEVSETMSLTDLARRV
ncbi:hypothetical protein BCR35DRAFT_350517 [Leucosporidium creatinivorum]|uniref:SET domain-containing protein n=1 Tax=Leucosporidium creatinivorum TaxID=106004 RepID=A0A1Y2G0L2_9BASI|nr:hypothetical protein BCR35DRAFT_350517 [Leucosporidium creatinivorum]